MDMMYVLYLAMIVLAFILLAIITGIVILGAWLYDKFKAHMKKCDDISIHISNIYHKPDKKG